MIVISGSLVLSQSLADEVNENNPIVGWKNLTTINNVFATSELVDRPVVNLANPSTYLMWEATTNTQQYLTVNVGSVDPIDYVGIAGHNFGSQQIAVSIEGDDGGGFDELVAPVTLPNDAPVIFRFNPTSLVSVRARLQSGIDPAIAAVMYVGKLLILPRRIYVGHRPLMFNQRTEMKVGRSEKGQFLGRIIMSQSVEGQVSQSNVRPSTYREDIEPWRLEGVLRPFFFGWRPGDYPLESAYCWGTGDMQVTNDKTNGDMQFSISLQGIVS